MKKLFINSRMIYADSGPAGSTSQPTTPDSKKETVSQKVEAPLPPKEKPAVTAENIRTLGQETKSQAAQRVGAAKSKIDSLSQITINPISL